MDVWQLFCDLWQDAWIEQTPEVAEMLLKQPAAQELAEDFPERPRGSSVCGWTIRGLSGLQPLLGDGSPDPGDRLAASGPMFADVSARIAALIPDDGWQGLAAQSYSAQNLAQSQRAKMMGDLDRRTGELVSAQAEAIQRVYYVVVAERLAVAGTFAFCIYYEVTGGPAGQILSFQVAVAVCTVAIIVLSGFLIDLWITTSQNAIDLQAATQKLTDMLTMLPTLSDTIPGLPDGALPPSHTRPEFDAARLLDFTGPLPETPDISLAFADLPGSLEFNLPTLPSPGFPDFGAPHLPIPQLTGMPTLPDPFCGADGLPRVPTANELAASPDFSGALAGLPIMAQLTAPFSRLTGLPGAAGGLSQLTNTAGQQAQMISSLTQQGARPQAPPADQVTRDGDTAGAAAGTPGARRVPVDAATDPSQQGQQRVM